MRITNIFLITLFLLFNSSDNTTSLYGGTSKKKSTPKGDLYIIAIGVNIDGAGSCTNCENDAVYFTKKIISDYEKEKQKIKELKVEENAEELLKIKKQTKQIISSIIPITLTNEEATIENIESAFKSVISQASSNDYFIFTYSGVSFETSKNNTYLLPHDDYSSFDWNAFHEENKNITKKLFSLSLLANFMEQIACENQFVISEAGVGKSFGINLIYNLFESNPEIISNTIRNRIILTTNGPGMDGDGFGKLMTAILKIKNISQIITNFRRFELNLNNALEECDLVDDDYAKIFFEKDHREILLAIDSKAKNNSRGSKPKPTNKEVQRENEEIPSKNYAFVIASNEYQSSDWSNLKNPLNDADTVSELLINKYGFEVTKVYNSTKLEVLKRYTEFRKTINEKDKVIFFVAGHGHFESIYGDGYLAFIDSKDLTSDFSLESYLSMATLNRMLDALPSKQVLSIFDVCYGASFELNNGDLAVENYNRTTFDKGLDNFIKEKDKNICRIMLASGKYEVPDYWNNSLDHSPFANKLIKALEQESEFISPGKIYSYVLGNATRPILKKFGKHEVTGDFLLKALN